MITQQLPGDAADESHAAHEEERHQCFYNEDEYCVGKIVSDNAFVCKHMIFTPAALIGCGASVAETIDMISQDESTKCTDPADKDAVIRDLRIEKNGLLCIINSIRKDAEAAHKNVADEMGRGAWVHLRDALNAIENIIESVGVTP